MMPVQLTKLIQDALLNVQLLQGEEIEYAVQADGFFAGSNPIAKMMAKVQAFITKITGGHIRSFLVLTNMRVFVIETTAVMCGWQASKNAHTIAIKSIVEASTKKETKMCCIHTRSIGVESLTQKWEMVVKKMNDTELLEFLTRMGILITRQ
jgi:hypothetical protein